MADHERSQRFLRACRRERTDRTPIWIMRQAGRYIPEYRAIREKHGFLEIARSPDLVTQVTLMPVRMMPLDAAIIFADIALPFEGLGLDLRLEENVGPVIDPPVRTAEQIAGLRSFDAERDVPYLLEGIRQVRAELDGEVPLIGFSGAPFTLACYLVEGGGRKRGFERTKSMLISTPSIWADLMDRLTDTVIRYLKAQVEAGAQAVQLFDSWVGALSPADYERAVQPYMTRIFEEIGKMQGPDGRTVPAIHFGTGTATLLGAMARAGGDVIGVDWRIPLDEAWSRIGADRAIQGNLDPCALLAGFDVVRERAMEILDLAAGRAGHIFNLGHGVLPSTPVDNVRRLVDLVHDPGARPAG